MFGNLDIWLGERADVRYMKLHKTVRVFILFYFFFFFGHIVRHAGY